MKVVTKHISLTVTRICTILVMLSCVQTINAGTTEMTYDAAGNLLTKLTAELKKSISDKGCITYTYDHERVKEVLYPKNLFNRVTYTYGAPGDKYNRAGRIALIEDASGGEAYYYGRMGEVVKTVRTVMASAADVRTYVHGATYDSWNRVRTMTYPDGEVVTYHYNEAGQVSSLTSNKNGVESVIVDMMGYDEFGHTVYQKLGNGTETTYEYDRQRQRLQEMNLSTAGSQMMQNRYEYDKVDNILSLINSVNPQNLTERNSAKLGGMSTHRYQYDELNRLISAQGKAKSASYDMSMTFNAMSMPTSKVQTVDSTETAASYHNIYSYDDRNHPTAPTQIGHDHYEYDANGNPVLVTNDSLNTTRELYWDEENRLSILSDNGKTSRYTYNHAGDRIVKSHGDLEGVYINGAPQGITFHEHDDFTIYPASIISVNKNRFTKHYFIGSQRIASKLGSGRFNNVYGRNGSYITAGQQDYAERLNQIESQREEYYKDLGIAPGVPTMKGAYGDPENMGVGYNTIITELGDHSVPKNWEQYVVKRGPGETPGPPIIWSDPQNPDEAQPGYGYIADDSAELEETFFYHSDHLGSTSYITDQDGNITQYTAYLPYGELLVDEHSSSEDLPYKFNGKELDEETGLYYYGARYLQPISSIWYGVDPLMEKYPNVSPYVYCLGNPVNAIDTDGRKVKPVGELSLSIILNTLPQEARQYITLNDDGYIDFNTMAKYKGESANFSSLMTLVESNMDVTVTTLQETQYIRNGELFSEQFNQVQIDAEFIDKGFQYCSGNTTGEYGNLGVTYMPVNGSIGKEDAHNPSSIHININPTLSPVGAAETFSHECYGHALMYVETGGNRERAIHRPINGKDTNVELVHKIITARKETVKNMDL